jgi:hypothetical protein
MNSKNLPYQTVLDVDEAIRRTPSPEKVEPPQKKSIILGSRNAYSVKVRAESQ